MNWAFVGDAANFSAFETPYSHESRMKNERWCIGTAPIDSHVFTITSSAPCATSTVWGLPSFVMRFGCRPFCVGQ